MSGFNHDNEEDIVSVVLSSRPELLTMLDIDNSVITLDTIGCQEKIAKKIVQQNAAH